MASTDDILALKQIAYRYADAIDRCDANALLALFCPEARIAVFGPGAETPFTVTTGHAEIARIPPSMKARYVRTAHLMTNHVVDIDGDMARGTVLCTARHLLAGTAVRTDLVVMIRYVDRYERRDRWLIRDREIRFLWSEAHAAHTDAETVRLIHGA